MDKKIVSFNVNGLRSAIQKGLLEWLSQNTFDIVCLQEIKMDASLADSAVFEDLGFHSYWHSAQKKGYSGILTLSREKPTGIEYGCGIPEYDCEGRIMRLDFGDWSVINCYIPSGSSGEDRHAFKMQFLRDFGPWMQQVIAKRKKLIVVGDYNIVHKELDIHNPDRKDNPSGYRPDERAWLNEWFDSWFADSFRTVFPDKREFSWWSYRAGSYQKDKGWRIDYQSISKPWADRVMDYKHHKTIRFSDHCPIEGVYRWH